jgi:hypothetical protein
VVNLVHGGAEEAPFCETLARFADDDFADFVQTRSMQTGDEG